MKIEYVDGEPGYWRDTEEGRVWKRVWLTLDSESVLQYLRQAHYRGGDADDAVRVEIRECRSYLESGLTVLRVLFTTWDIDGHGHHCGDFWLEGGHSEPTLYGEW